MFSIALLKTFSRKGSRAGKTESLQGTDKKCCGRSYQKEGAGAMKQVNIKKLILPNLPYFLIGLYASKLGEAWRMAEGAELSDKFMNLMDGFAAAFASPFPSFYPPDFLVGVLCGAALRLVNIQLSSPMSTTKLKVCACL